MKTYSYPAGFVYIFTILYLLTNGGSAIRLAQYIFALLYLANVVLVFTIYRSVRKVCITVSIHYIFVSVHFQML